MLEVVLIASGVVVAVSGGLSILLLVAERYLANYGECRIDINRGERDFTVKGGETLLMSLKNEGIFVPSACGGRGTCAYCKVTILEGGGVVAPTELPLLTDQEVRDNVRISCQCKVRNDLKISLPEALLSVQEYRGVVERIRDLTHDNKEVRIRLVEPDAIEFTPGQYIQLEAPPYEGSKESVFRAYSISSPPDDAGHIELIIRLVPDGICTTWVFEHLAEGDEVTFTGPFGEFRLSGTDAEMFWIAGGSGMAPFWSLVRHMKAHGPQRKTTYFFGAVARRDMFLLDELRALEKELNWFRFVPALSSPAEGDDWDGETGLITEVVDRGVGGGEGKEGYLCGSPGMIDAAIKALNAKGITEERIFFDKFA